MIHSSLIRNGLVLGAIAIVATVLTMLVSSFAHEHIAREQAQTLKRTLLEVMPADRLDNALVEDRLMLEPNALLGTSVAKPAYIALKNGVVSGVILQVGAPKGYGGTIHLLVGVDNTGTITGVRVMPPHFETAGLGDYIELRKSDWILSFNGKSLNNPTEQHWRVKKDSGDFDAVAGATITGRAVVDAVHKALLYVNEHQALLMPPPTASGVSEPAASAEQREGTTAGGTTDGQ